MVDNQVIEQAVGMLGHELGGIRHELMLLRKMREAMLTNEQLDRYQVSVEHNKALTDYLDLLAEKQRHTR